MSRRKLPKSYAVRVKTNAQGVKIWEALHKGDRTLNHGSNHLSWLKTQLKGGGLSLYFRQQSDKRYFSILAGTTILTMSEFHRLTKGSTIPTTQDKIDKLLK